MSSSASDRYGSARTLSWGLPYTSALEGYGLTIQDHRENPPLFTFDHYGWFLVPRRWKHIKLKYENMHSLIAGLRPASSILARRVASPLLFGTGLMLAQPCAGLSFEFQETGSLATARASHTATLLPDGKVLVAGGATGSSVFASTELYNPASATGRPAASSYGSLASTATCCETVRCCVGEWT